MTLQHTQEGFIIDVPVTLTVAVRGEGLTEKQAKDIARKFTENLDTDHMLYVGELKTNEPDTTSPVITETSMEFSSEDECEVIDELEAEPQTERERVQAENLARVSSPAYKRSECAVAKAEKATRTEAQ